MSRAHDVDFHSQIESILGVGVVGVSPLSGGSVAQVVQAKLDDGSRVVAKQDRNSRGQLGIEGKMLAYLAQESCLPVPRVLHSDERILLLEYVEGASQFTAGSQRHAAELLADLHQITAQAYGFEYDTLIGGLHQPNTRDESWLRFFRDQRLIYMGREGMEKGRLPRSILARLEKFCERLDEWLEEPVAPSLIHGDAWTGNMLASSDRITAFLDPAIYFADPEIELAFTTLFGTFDDSFFGRYREIRPLRSGFMQVRRQIYNLYPLLVHVRLFGGGYVQSVDQTLASFGF